MLRPSSPVRPPTPMLFVFENDEIIVVRGDISPTDAAGSGSPSSAPYAPSAFPSSVSTPSTPTSRSSPASPSVPFGLSDPSSLVLRARTPPPPPPKIPPAIGRGSGYTPAEYARAVLFPSMYGAPLEMIDIEAMVERSYSPVGDPYAVSDESEDSHGNSNPVPSGDRDAESDIDAAFEALHAEFMDRILLSGRVALQAAADARAAERASVYSFAPARNSSTCLVGEAALHRAESSDAARAVPISSIDSTFYPPELSPTTPHVTEPLKIQKRTPSPGKSVTSATEKDEGSAQPASSPRHAATQAGEKNVTSTCQASLTRAARKRPSGPRTPRASIVKVEINTPASPDRTPSPSPLLRTPDTPPAPTLPDAVRGYFPAVPAPNLHARREAAWLEQAQKEGEGGEGPGGEWHTPAQSQSPFQSQAPSASQFQSHPQPQSPSQSPSRPGAKSPRTRRPPPTIVIPPIALGPLPPVPRESRALNARFPQNVTANGGLSPTGPDPRRLSPPAPSPTAGSGFGFTNRIPNRGNDSGSNGNSGNSRNNDLFGSSGTGNLLHSGASINRSVSSSTTSSRRPLSMQPQASPREFASRRGGGLGEFGALGGSALGLTGPLRRSPHSPNFAGRRPTSTVSYHFGGITIPASSPVVQAFEDIGAIGIIGPTSPFTQPRPAPRPSGLISQSQLDFDSDDDYEREVREHGLPSPITPSNAPPKARAILGLYTDTAPKKQSPFVTIFRGRNHDNRDKDRDKWDKEKDKGKGKDSEQYQLYGTQPMSPPQHSPQAPAHPPTRRGVLGLGKRKGSSAGLDEPPCRAADELVRVGTNDSATNMWDNPDNFAPLSGYARQGRAGTPNSARAGTPNGSIDLGVPFAERDHSHLFHNNHERHPPRPKRPPYAMHGHAGSVGSTHSVASVGSTYPVSVLSHKSSFEVPPAKVYPSPRTGSSFKSSVDGDMYATPQKRKGSASAASPNSTMVTSPHAPSHRSKGSLDIPNLTPNSKAGIHAPPPSDHVAYGVTKVQYHAPSLSPITYVPPPGSNPPPIAVPERVLKEPPPRTSSLAAQVTISPKRSPPPPQSPTTKPQAPGSAPSRPTPSPTPSSATRAPPPSPPKFTPTLSRASSSDDLIGRGDRKRPPPIKVMQPRVVNTAGTGGSGFGSGSGSGPGTGAALPSASSTPLRSADTTHSAGSSRSAHPPGSGHPFAQAGHAGYKTSAASGSSWTERGMAHVPVGLHLRQQSATQQGQKEYQHHILQPHPPHPHATANGSAQGTATVNLTVNGRPRAPSHTSLMEESYFEPETPSPRGHFKGLRNVVKGHWDNRI